MESKVRYIHEEKFHNKNAAKIVLPLVLEAVKPASVIDIGCGLGTWLAVCEESGIRDYLGVDGDYLDKTKLTIPAAKFRSVELRESFDLNRKFDLVISLEVAEHLPESSADIFVESIIKHGDTVLFSAAIPGQGGQNHLNEQPPTYWQKKFEKHGYFFHDVIRPLIWENEQIDWWYRQNIFLIRRHRSDSPSILFAIHPQLFYLNQEYHQRLINGEYGIELSFKIFIRSIFRKIANLFS